MSSAVDEVLKIQREWLKFVGVKGIGTSSFARLLKFTSKLAFIEPGQFIFEFLQNAEDALMEAKRVGFFKIEFRKGADTKNIDYVIIEHNGKPFDIDDIKGFCSITTKKKPSKGYKGYIGLGAKSVFKVSDYIEVYSGKFTFKIRRNTGIVLKVKNY